MGADVDATGRLVQHQKARRGGEPAGEQHLLLVAAGQQPDRPLRLRRADVEQLDETQRNLFLLGARQRFCEAALGLQRQHDIFAHGEIGNDALGLALFGAIAEAMGNRVARRLQLDRLAFDRGAAAVGALGAKHQPRGFGAPRPEQARQANHLAAAKREIERRKVTGLAIVFEARADLPHLPHLRRGARWSSRRVRAEHHADQFDPRQFGCGPLPDQPAVAQHRDAVADLIDLIEKMRDEDDADAA